MSRTFLSRIALVSLAHAAAFSSDDAGAAIQPPAPSPIAEFEFPNLPGKVQLDCTTIRADVRLDLLKGAVRSYIANRLNGVHTRYDKDETVLAWNAYNKAVAADALQTAVAKPEKPLPAAPDYQEAYSRAVSDLQTGNVRKQGTGEPRARTTVNPLIKTITDVVVREVYDSKRAADPKYSFLTARKEVGQDGLAYLNSIIEAKSAADPTCRAGLEKMREERYIGPAKAMLGLTPNKKTADLPSIL